VFVYAITAGMVTSKIGSVAFLAKKRHILPEQRQN